MKDYLNTDFTVRHLKNLANRLRQARTEAGFSLSELENLTKISGGFLSKIENCKVIPSIPIVLRLAEKYHKEPGWFFTEEQPIV